MLWHSCLQGYLLLGHPARAAAALTPCCPLGLVFGVAIFWLSEKNHIWAENNGR